MINENDQKILISYINHILIEKNRKNFLETVNILFMNKFRLFLLVCFLLFMVSVIPHKSGFAEENLLLHSNAAEKHILILNSHQQGLPIPDGVIGGVLRSLKMNQVSVDNIYIEHLDFFRFNTPGHRADMARLLEKKYKNIRIDLIITVTKPALDFIDNEGKGLSPYTPVLATIIPVEKRGGIEKKFKRKVAILPWRMDSAGTLRYALKLFPETRRVVVVNGIHDEFLPFLPSAREDFAAWEGKIDFEYTMDLTYNEMIKRIGSLPPDCIVIYAPYFADKTGKSFIPVEVAVMVGKSANVPVFSLIDIYINSGIIGGSVLQSGIIGEQAGKFALDLINKRIALTEQITLVNPVYVPMFDWIQLNRSGGNISVLPPESVFLNRPLTLWGQYKVIVLASTAVFIIMIIFSSALVSRNRRLKAAEQSIRESEEKFKSMANTTPLAIYMSSGIEQKAEYINPTFTKLFGYTIEDVPFVSNWWPLAYPDEEYRKTISEEWQRKVENAIINRSEIEPMEAVVTCKDGSRKNIIWGFVSTGIQNWAFGLDLTERKQAEAKINDLLAAKELLLQEVHHRIKNNMNTIKGLLTLQLTAEENPSAAASLRDAESRVQSMIMLYDRLYSTENFRELSVKDYLQPLTEEIVGSFPNFAKVKIETDIEDFILNVKTLSPLGIIVNELLTNMMKYAFTGRDSGEIRLSASVMGNLAVVSIQDNGVGMPETMDFKNSTGFGLELVNMLVDQLGGSIRIERGEGTRFVLEFTV